MKYIVGGDTMLKKYQYPLLLCLIITVLLFLSIPKGAIFGSHTDWLNQHVSIAEHLRTTFYDTKQLLPDYSTLGAGSNMFMFAYYGILRPDVLIGFFLPFVPMQSIIIGYSILGIYASMLLCYHWLRKNIDDPVICFTCSLLFICSACFFQSHRQIMFINYMPFMLILLLSIDSYSSNHKISGMTLSLFFILLHSFFFSISCFVVGLLYVLYKKNPIRQYLFSFFLATGLSAMILVPTGLVILENKKDAGTMAFNSLFGLKLSFKNMLYSPYGCGLTIVSLYSLLLSIKKKETRFLAISIGLLFIFNIFSYVLNGTLYIRDKTFIPFLPLLILLCANSLTTIQREHKQVQLFLVLLLSILIIFQGNKLLYFIDLIILLCFLLLRMRFKSQWMYVLLCLIPISNYVQTNRSDEFVSATDQKQHRFTPQEIQSHYQDANYRFDFLNAALTNVNYSPIDTMKKSTMYSSTMNTQYATYFYDILKNPISIKNRVALLANQNPFFAYMMSIRYIQTKSNAIPYDYTTIYEKDGFVLAENTNVLPIAYVNSNVINEQEFDTIAFPYYLDVMTNNTIVSAPTTSNYKTHIKQTPINFNPYTLLDSTNITQTDKKTAFTLSKETKLSIPLDTPLVDEILILSFTIDNPTGEELIVSINQIQNKLSGNNASYPNKNHQFVYMISSNDAINKLDITLSKGDYSISNVTAHTIKSQDIKQNSVQPVQLEKPVNKEVLKGSVTTQEDGYFVTSLPYQKGYTAYLNKKEIPIECVNKAFIGFPITKGEHEIVIVYHAPGKQIGIYLTTGSFFLLLYISYQEKRSKR